MTLYVLTITCEAGSWRFTRSSMPRHWKSWLMRQVPYGTNLQGATITREQVARDD
jgi:hypothetical protein